MNRHLNAKKAHTQATSSVFIPIPAHPGDQVSVQTATEHHNPES